MDTSVHRYLTPPGVPVLTHCSPFGPLAYVTRRHAAHVGLQRDVTGEARALGFTYPVVMTSAAHAEAVTWADADSRSQRPQSEAARLQDALMALAAAAGVSRGSVLRFTVSRVPRDGRSRQAVPLTLRAECTVGDSGPCIFISTIIEE